MKKTQNFFNGQRRWIHVLLIVSVIMSLMPTVAFAGTGSAQQIVYEGGTKYYDHEGSEVALDSENHYVTATKEIAGTSTENVFDITLQVQTKEKSGYDEVKKDAAVALTIDLSNTMLEYCMKHSYNCSCATERIEIAINQAKDFVTTYGKEGEDAGTARYLAVVMFSGPAQTYVDWVDVSNSTNRNTVLTNLDKLTKTSIWKDGYRGGQTNVEGGLQLSYELLNEIKNDVDRSFCVLLSDGSPTAHIKVGHSKNAAGQYYYVCRSGNCSGTTCNSGDGTGSEVNTPDYTRAEKAAEKIKNLPDTQFYAIAVAGSVWLNKIDGSHDVNGTTAANWLATITGSSSRVISGDDEAGVKNAFATINAAIKTETIPESTWAKAVSVTDVLPANIQLVSLPEAASHNAGNRTITWNINAADSGTYTLTYRVRLMTGAPGYVAGTDYPTNEVARVTYTMMSEYGSTTETGATRTATFDVPKVEGYAGTLTFTKVSSHDIDSGLKDCTFKLTHKSDCGCGLNITAATATSLENGQVTFNKIPSGHVYTLTEESVPAGYDKNTNISTITVSYGIVTESGNLIGNDNKVVNVPSDNPQVFTVKKEWAGAASVDEVTVNIHKVIEGGKTGPVVATLKPGTANGWTASVTLPTIDVSTKTPIVYRAIEADGTNYKLLSSTDFDANRVATLTNVRTGTSNIIIQKNWAAPSGLTAPVTVRLLQTGKTFEEYTLNAGNNWMKTVSVPVYDNAGNEYEYKVVELDGAGNAVSSGGSIVINGHTYDVTIDGTTVTNKIQQEFTGVSGIKTWNAAGLSDAEKAALTATITLYQNGNVYATDTVTYTDTSYSFSELPKYTDDRSAEYTYTVAETAVSGNETGTWSSVQSGTNFTNTITDQVTISGTKTWVDPDDSERPGSITIKLMNGSTIVDSRTISAVPVYEQPAAPEAPSAEGDEGETPAEPANTDPVLVGYDWTGVDLSYSFTVPKYESNGAVISYHIAEDSVDMYQPTYDGYNVTNTLNGGEKTISAQKIWVDAVSEHETVTVGVYRTDNHEQAATIELNQANNWAGSAAVTKYDGGAEVNYYVRELNADGSAIEAGGSYGENYTVSYTQAADNWTVKNQINQEYVSVSGQKTWVGGGEHPDVTFTLYKNDVSTGLTRTQADLSEENGNLFTFEGLEKYTFSGDTCRVNIYTIKETMSGTAELLNRYGYDGNPVMGTADNNGVFQFVNTFTNDVTSVSGQKTWYGMGYSQEVKVGLFTGSTMIDSQTTSELKYEFAGLTKYNADGSLVQYSIFELNDQDEAMAEGTYYTSNGEEYEVHYNGYDIDNILKQKTTSVPVTKVWRGAPASSATFELYRAEGENGTPAPVLDGSGQPMTLTLTEADADAETGFWKGSFEGLDKYNENRTAEYIYSVTEAGVENGTITLDGNTYTAEATEGNIFINTIVDPKNNTFTVNKVWAGEGYNAENGEAVTVQLFANNVAYGGPVTLNKDNGWTHTYTDLPLYSEETYSPLTYTVGELDESGALVADGGIITMNNGAERYEVTYSGGTVTNTLKDVDSYKYRVLRHYTYTYDGEVSTFTDDDLTWTRAAKDEIVNIDAAQWTNCSTDDKDVVYGFNGNQSDVYQGTNGEYAFTQNENVVSFVTEKFVDGESWYEVYLYYSYTYTTPPAPPVITPETVNVSVSKIWNDNNDEAGMRPDSVTVQLIKDGEEAGTSELSEANGWSHIWTGLEADHKYAVAELNVADGYVSSVTGNGTDFTVINTFTTEIVEEPEVPGDDKYLEDPDIIIDIKDPDVPLAEIEDMEVPLSDVPKTSDESRMYLWMMMAMMSALAFVTSIKTEKKEER